MGCECSHDERNAEFKNEFYQKNYDVEEKIKTNPNLLKGLITLQSIIKGRFFRKNFNKQLNNNNEEEIISYKFINTDKIDQKE